jgi:CRP/FNR family cyclic AMP-dependent transcriptional regulator
MSTHPEPVERIDLRPLPTWERHDRMLMAFDRLAPNQVAEFINDHEPKALRATVEGDREGVLLWDSRNAGDGRWVIRITRLPEPALGGEAPRIAYLRRCTMFKTATQETLREIDRVAKERTYHDRMVIVAEGTTWTEFGLVRRGVVEVTRATDEDREIVLYDVPPYGGFNEAAVFDEGTAEVTVIARGDVDVLEIPAQFMRQLITRSPEIATGVARFFAQRQRRLTSAAGNLAFGRVLTRIARVLLDYASPQEGMAPGVSGVERITQSDLAARVGTVRDMGSRALSHLEDMGAIELRRGRVVMLNRAALEEIVRTGKAAPNEKPAAAE